MARTIGKLGALVAALGMGMVGASCAQVLGIDQYLDCPDDPACKPLCNDGVQNGTESDKDCGGGCDPCKDGQGCNKGSDCQTGFCNAGGVCAPAPTCTDGAKNGTETDQDCGGGACPKCTDGKGCENGGDCQSGFCSEGKTCETKVAPTCTDGAKNGTETDQDCGGSCGPCEDGKGCGNGGDCQSKVCTSGTCVAAATCTDGTRNGNETDIDCGGSCDPCDDSKGCSNGGDCKSKVCSGGTCVAPATCFDSKRNGNETDVDCGGSCDPCDDGQGCNNGGDCKSKVCGSGGSCLVPTCTDLVKNGAETDADCGGGACPKCGNGKACAASGDCQSGVCSNGLCVAATCTDQVKNGTETAVDCGGPACSPCGPGLTCGSASDCESGICTASSCVDIRVWGKRFGDADLQHGDRVSVSSSGDVYVQGSFLGAVDLGGGALVDPCVPDPQMGSLCAPDWYVGRLHSDGSYAWAKRIANLGDGYLHSSLTATADGSGNTFLTAVSNWKMNLGGSDLSPPSSCGGHCSEGVVLGKLDSLGVHKWSKRFDATGTGSALISGDIAADASGRPVIVGMLQSGSVLFGGSTTLTSSNSAAFVAAFDTNGNHRWSKAFGSSQATFVQCGASLAMDAGGNSLVAGYFAGTMIVGGTTLTAAGQHDIFVAKLDSAGTPVWSKGFGDAGTQSVSGWCFSVPGELSVATDGSGNVLVAGTLKGAFGFGGTTLTGNGADAFVAKLSPSGAHVWSKRIGGVALGRVASDGTGAVWLTGTSTGAIDFGSSSLAGAGGFVAKLSSGGVLAWSHRFTGIAGNAIASDGAGHLLLTGDLKTSADFGGTPMVSAGSSDAFVAKILAP